MFLKLAISALICAQMNFAFASQSNYNNYNKQQYNNVQSQSQFGQNYQQTHHHQQHYNAPNPQIQHIQGSYQSNRNVIPITSFKNEMHHDGSYQYSYSTGNGISAGESGYLKNRGTQNQAQVAQGSYSYTAPNGQLIEVRYIADELGFRAEGNHLPKPPPIPEAIQKSLQLIARTQPAPATHNYSHQQHQQHQHQSGQYNQQFDQQHKYGK